MYKKIIVIVGMPRSGTNWLSQIIESCPNVRFRLSPFFSYDFKNMVNEDSSKAEFEKVFQGAYISNNEFMTQMKNRSKGHFPIFKIRDKNPPFLAIKMTRFHNLLFRMLKLFDNLKIVLIIRHPCGAINSWIKSKNEFPKNADYMKEWRYGKCRKISSYEFWGFEDWKKVTRLHLSLQRKYPKKFFIQKYEALIDYPLEQTKNLFKFLDLNYTAQTNNFLIESQNKHDNNEYAVFKDKSVKDKWKKELSKDIANSIIADLKGGPLEVFLE